MLKAITRQARLVDEKVSAHNKNLRPGANPLTVAGFFDHHATDEDTEVMVSEEDFDSARRELVPSVSWEELQHYERVRKTFEGNGDKKAAAVEGPKIAVQPSATPLAAITNSSSNGTHNHAPPPNPPQKSDTRRISASKLKGLREKTLNSLHRSRSRGDKSAVVAADNASQASQDDSEDEYTIDTSHLANGNGNGKAVQSVGGGGKGKASGKGKSSGSAFGDGAEDEDLYA
jgi:peroxin-6